VSCAAVRGASVVTARVRLTATTFIPAIVATMSVSGWCVSCVPLLCRFSLGMRMNAGVRPAAPFDKFFEAAFSSVLSYPAGAGKTVGSYAAHLRGGSWNNNRDNARAAYRNNNHPGNRNNNIGFRVVCVVRPTSFPLFIGHPHEHRRTPGRSL